VAGFRPAVEQPRGGAGVDGFGGAGHAVSKGLRDRVRGRHRREAVGSRQAGGGVEQDDVADRARFAGQHAADHAGVARGVAAAQAVQGRPGQAERVGVELGRRDRAVGDDPHRRRAGRGELVDAPAVEHDRGVAAPGEHAGQHRAHPRVSDADRQRRGPGRVGQRPEVVERRRHAKIAAHRAGVPQRRVVQRREEKGDAELGEQRLGGGRRQVDHHAEGLEHVGRAAGGRRRPVAVLDHPGAGRRRDDRRHRRHVDRVRAVGAAADQVRDRTGNADRGRVREHARGQAGHLLRGLPLGPQPHAEPGDLGRGCRPVHDLVHRPGRLAGAERLAADQRADKHGTGRPVRGRRSHQGTVYPAAIAAARDRIRAASSLASATGSIGWLTTASARDQVASQRSSARAMTSSTGGQL